MNTKFRNSGWFGVVLAAVMMFVSVAWSAPPVDTDGDGIPDDVELALGYNPLVTTRVVYVDGAQADDSGNGLTPLTAKKTIKAGVNAAKVSSVENVVLVASGTYTGTDNKNLDIDGYDIKLIGTAGAEATIVDLEDSGPFLRLTSGETLASRLDGFTVCNGYTSSYGIAVHLNSASLDIRNCVFRNNRSGRKEEYDYGDGYVEVYWTDAASSAAVYASGQPVMISNTLFHANASGELWDWAMDSGNAGALILWNAAGSVIYTTAVLSATAVIVPARC
jgi:hypothetical protein